MSIFAFNPRRACAAIALALGILLALCSAAGAATNAYVIGGFSPGVISQFSLGAAGAMSPLAPPSVAAPDYPRGGAVAPDGRSLYVTQMDATGIVAQYSVDEAGALTAKSPPTVSTGTAYTTNVAVTPHGGGYAYVGTEEGLTRFAIDADGALGSPVKLSVPGTWLPVVSPDGRSLYVDDFNSFSSIWQFSIGPDGSLTPKTPASVPAGFKSPWLAVAPDGRSAYAVADDPDVVAGTRPPLIYQYSIAPDGTMSPLSPATVSPPSDARELAVSADSKSVYATVGGGEIAQYDVGPDGALTPKTPATAGASSFPISLVVDSTTDSLYVTDHSANTISRYPIGADGLLGAADDVETVGDFAEAIVLNTPGPLRPRPGPVPAPDPAGVAPTANAVATPGARRPGGQRFAFDGGLSVDPDGRIAAYRWTLDGKVISTGSSFNRYFSKQRRSYTVTLTVSDAGGLTGSTSVTVSPRAKRAPVVRILVPGTARFCYGCSHLSAAAKRLIAAMRKYARGARSVTVSSYADSTGSAAGNLRLTHRRTLTVAAALLGKLAPRPKKTRLHWFGSRRPVASNSTTAGRARNRRTEIRIVR